MPTVIDLINDSAARLEQARVAFGHGTANAFDEAAWLVLWKLGYPLDQIDEHVAVADLEPLKNIYRRVLENLNVLA